MDQPASRPKILVIDQSELIHRLLKLRLKREVYDLHDAWTGAQGIEMAAALQPDVILLEFDLSDLKGEQVLEQLKSNANVHNIPVIMLSAECSAERKVRCLDLGASDFVTKPFDVSELRARVRSTVRLRGLMKMLAQRAHLDGLTGLWNRAHFDMRLEQVLAEAVRHDSPLTLVICDLDRFKLINDTHGHPLGDHVLQTFASLLVKGRTSDVACRYGGDEFAMILPRTSMDEAIIAVERIDSRLRSIQWPDRPQFHVTASFGMADLNCCLDSTPAAMIAAADAALYDVKCGKFDGVGRARRVVSTEGQRSA